MDKRPPPITRDKSPCTDCAERFTACHDKCPKDNRGEYGYKAWKDELFDIKKKRTDYNLVQRRVLWDLKNR